MSVKEIRLPVSSQPGPAQGTVATLAGPPADDAG